MVNVGSENATGNDGAYASIIIIMVRWVRYMVIVRYVVMVRLLATVRYVVIPLLAPKGGVGV